MKKLYLNGFREPIILRAKKRVEFGDDYWYLSIDGPKTPPSVRGDGIIYDSRCLVIMSYDYPDYFERTNGRGRIDQLAIYIGGRQRNEELRQTYIWMDVELSVPFRKFLKSIATNKLSEQTKTI